MVLCATLTADGKLDASAPALPPELYEEDTDPARHPWGRLYNEAGGILVSAAMLQDLPMPAAARRTVVTFPPEAMSPEKLSKILERLRREGVTRNLLCFGGAELFRALLEAGRVDDLRLIVRPKIDGRRGSAALSGAGGEFFPASAACRLVRMEVSGDGCFLHYRVRRDRPTAGKIP